MNGLSVHNLTKYYGNQKILDGISFDAPSEGITALLGPSGCGKSTLLRIIAGLENAEQGEILWDDQPYTLVPSHRRGFGLMFQDYALFPHLNVYQNIAFGLLMNKFPPSQIRQRVQEMLALVNLQGFEDRSVHTLSGGEAQRVALARTLAPRPRLVMLDEPMGSLDRTLRDRLLVELRAILRELKLTSLYVTHDQEEAFAIADQIIVLNAGHIEQTGTPQEIYQSPKNVFVARFLGLVNLIPAQGEGAHALTAIGKLPLPFPVHGRFTILIRPEAASTDGDAPLQLEGKVIERTFLGSICRATVNINGVNLLFHFSPQACIPNENQTIRLALDPQEAIQVLRE